MGWLLLGLLAAALLAASLRPMPRAGKTPPAAPTSAAFARADRPASPDSRTTPARTGRSAVGAPDPFEVLRLQLRLGVLAEEVRTLERSTGYGRMHHWTATQAAYDALLGEACLLAGISLTNAPDARRTVPQDEQERFREEVELASRGWTW